MTGEPALCPELDLSAVILAGGRSSRLGRDKSLLVLDGQPLIVRTVQTLACLSEDLVVVTNDPDRYAPLSLPARLVPDEARGVGSLMGIYSGLRAARHSYAIVVACDMPFLNVALLRHMAALAEDYDVVIPRIDGLLEPLHAVYGKACLRVMAELLQDGRHKIRAFFHRVRVRYVDQEDIRRFDPQGLSFFNINTAEDWAHVQAMLQG
jgi:molybdopterin-guanine dinucleotide biosynthesis protein A